MSVILNALRSQQQRENTAEQHLSNVGEGLFLGKKKFGGGKFLNLSKTTLILCCVLAVFSSSAVVLRLWKNSLVRSQPEAAKPQMVGGSAKVAAVPGAEPKHLDKKEQEMPTPVEVPPSYSSISEEAKLLFLNGHLDESIKVYQEALLLDPKNASLHNDIGYLFLKKELYTSAEKHFSRSVELDDQCTTCFNNFGYLKTLLGEWVEAEKYLKRAAALNSQYPDPYFNLGVLYEKNGDFGNAVSAYQAFLERTQDPNAEIALKVKKHVKELIGN